MILSINKKGENHTLIILACTGPTLFKGISRPNYLVLMKSLCLMIKSTSVPVGVALTEWQLWCTSLNIRISSIDPQSLSPKGEQGRSTQSVVQFSDAASYWRGNKQKSSSHLSVLCFRTARTEFVLTTIFHPSFLGCPLGSFKHQLCNQNSQIKSCYPRRRKVALIVGQKRNSFDLI